MTKKINLLRPGEVNPCVDSVEDPHACIELQSAWTSGYEDRIIHTFS